MVVVAGSHFVPNKSSGVLVVPPFECTWLEGDGLVLPSAGGCLSFQAKGQTDATVILSTIPGSKRLPQSERGGLLGSPTRRSTRPLQHFVTGASEDAVGKHHPPGRVCTVIFGSHGNSKFKVEKDEADVVLRHDLPQACLDRTRFKPFWLNLEGGVLTVGAGSPGCGAFVRWTHDGLQGSPLHVGLSCWDSHVGYRNVLVSPPLDGPLAPPDAPDVNKLSTLALRTLAAALRQAPAPSAPALARRSLDACVVRPRALEHAAPNRSFDENALAGGGGADAPGAPPPPLLTACQVLAYLDLTWRASDALWDGCVDCLARHFVSAAAEAPAGLALLPPAALLQVLSSAHLDASECVAFAAVELWAFGGAPLPRGRRRGLPSAADDPSSRRASANGASTSGDGRPCNPASNSMEAALWPEGGAHLNARERMPPDLASDESGAPRGTSGSDFEGEDGWGLQRREDDVVALLQRIKFPLMSNHEQARVRASPLWGLVPALRELLDEACGQPEASGGGAAGAAAAASLSDLLRSSRRQRRCPAGAQELLYISDGDQHGVLYFIGTNHGTCAWMNPHLTGAVRVESSSPFGSFSDPRKLLSRCYHGSLCAEARPVGGQHAAFWSLDLGPHHRLACNHYTLRQNDSTEFPRRWSLQASQDGGCWHDLKVHVNDGSFCAPAQFHSWPVEQTDLDFYRFFRVVAYASSLGRLLRLNVNYIELYGYFM